MNSQAPQTLQTFYLLSSICHYIQELKDFILHPLSLPQENGLFAATDEQFLRQNVPFGNIVQSSVSALAKIFSPALVVNLFLFIYLFI